MNGTAPPIPLAVVTASAMLAAAIGVLATLRRGHWLVTLLFSSAFLCMGAFQAGTLGILHADTPAAARMWATYLAGISALASWLWLSLSVVLARPNPIRQLRQAVAYLTLALVGCVVMFYIAGTRYVVEEVRGTGADAEILLGGMGKVYLMYLVVVMVAVLMNLESMVRTAPASGQRRLRPLFVAFVLGILADLLLVSAGLLYGGIRISWMVMSAVPMFVAGVITAFALARQRLSDMSIPVARPVVYYSSVSLTLAGAFLLTMAALSKVLPILTPEWNRIVSIAFYVIVGGGGLVLTFSPRTNRAIKRFIDRNFYANRYDYRREWERVSQSIKPTARAEDICRQIDGLLKSMFDAEAVVIHLRDDRVGAFLRVHPPTDAPPVDIGASLGLDNALVEEVDRSRVPLVFKELAHDLDLIPVAVENRDIIQAISAAVCAPLHVGEEMVGLVWLSKKHTDEEYSYEDIEFLGTLCRHLAAALWSARLAEKLAETRQLESLNRLSSFVLHDIKNQVSGLSLVLENARRHMGDPEFQRDAMRVLERTVENLKQLMGHVAGVAKPSVVRRSPVEVRKLVDDAVTASGLREGTHDGLRVAVRCRHDGPVELDSGLMMRVMSNLLVNAREAVQGDGEIEIEVGLDRDDANGRGTLVFQVRDNGPGMSEDFVRHSLFRPFATTKSTGLGIGLMQTKAIVEAHGGSIAVESRPGKGARFSVRVPVHVVEQTPSEESR